MRKVIVVENLSRELSGPDIVVVGRRFADDSALARFRVEDAQMESSR